MLKAANSGYSSARFQQSGFGPKLPLPLTESNDARRDWMPLAIQYCSTILDSLAT